MSDTPKRKSKAREALIQATFELFLEKGFAGITTREVAERAGVNEVTLFRHFGNKDNLMNEAVAECCPVPEVEGLLAVIQRFSYQDGLGTLVRGLNANTMQSAVPMRRLLLESMQNETLLRINQQIPVKLRALIRAHLERGIREGYVRKDINPDLMAQILLWINLAYTLTITQPNADEVYPYSNPEVLETVIQLFLRGLSPDPEPAGG